MIFYISTNRLLFYEEKGTERVSKNLLRMVQRVLKKSNTQSFHKNPSESVKSRKRGRPPINKIFVEIPSHSLDDSKVSASSDIDMDRRLTRSHSMLTIQEGI